MAILDDDLFLVNRGGASYRCEAVNLQGKIQPADLLLVNRNGDSHKISGTDFLDGLFLDDDLFLVNRLSTSYKVTGDLVRGLLDPNVDVVGTIAYWAIAPTSLPEDWFVCNGQQISSTDYPVLAALLGESGGLVTVPSLASGEYLAHTSNDGGIGSTVAATVKASGITVTPNGLTYTCDNTNGSWTGSFTSNSHSHGHWADGGSSFPSGDTGNTMGSSAPHKTFKGAWAHRPDGGGHNSNRFQGMRNSHNHTHPSTSTLIWEDGGAHSHTFSGSATIRHSHVGGSGLTASQGTGTPTAVELNAVELIPVIYAGVKGYI